MESLQQIRRLLPPLLSAQRASWEQGVASQALLEVLLSSTIQSNDECNSIIFRYLYALCHDALLRASDDGRLATRINSDDHGSGDGGALDPACIVESIYYVLAEVEGSTETSLADHSNIANWREKVDEMMGYLVHRAPRMMLSPQDRMRDDTLPEEGVLSHLAAPGPSQIWSDGVYMGPPALAAHALSSLSSAQLLESALDQVILMTHYLRLDSGLLAHNYDCATRAFPPATTNGMNGCRPWGIGNGWACGGIIRILQTIHRSFNRAPWLSKWLHRDTQGLQRVQRVYDILLDILDSCLQHQRPADGLFHNIIDDPTTFVEVGLAQILAATVYRLLLLHVSGGGAERLRLLPLGVERAGRYGRVAESMFEAARGSVDRFGFVRGVCGSPRFDREGTAAEAQAWGIIMEVSRADWKACE